MGNSGRDDLVTDVADALTLDQEVEWERCAGLATPANRRVLDSLRSLGAIFAGRPAADAALRSGPPTSTEPFAGARVRRVLHALLAIAALDVAAALLVLSSTWNDYRGAHGELAVFLTTLFLGHVATACVLLLAGRGDQRAWLLGGFFLLKATLAPLHMVYASVWEIQPHLIDGFALEAPAPAKLLAHVYVLPFLFAPAFLWAFARECPRIRRRTRLDGLTRRMVPVSLGVGCTMWVALALSFELATAGYGTAIVFPVGDATIPALHLSALAAFAVVGLRARSAPADEARRVLVFSGGFVLYVGSALTYDVIAVFSPGENWLFTYEWTPSVTVIGLMRFPGMVLLWYAMLAVRVPHLREVVRAFYRRLLLRPHLLGMAAVAPMVALGWLMASRPERTVGAVIADPLAQSLAAALALMLLLVVGREQLLLRLDAWIFPETTDQRAVLAHAAATLARVGRITTVNRTVHRTATRGCGAPAVLLLTTDTDTEADDFRAPDDKMAPLARASAILHILETAGGSLRVHPGDRTSIFALLPPDDAAWVIETGADAIVPVPGPGAELFGVVVVGRRLDGRIVRSVDVPFLEALGAAAGLAVARLHVTRGPGARPREAAAAHECPVCRAVTDTADSPACDCGSAYVEAEVPKLLAGKYRLIRRLGRGGMGAVYLARDLRLERDVAVKTLTGMSASRLMGMKPEAWAMATVTHPAVVQIYGVESWRGRPFLVVEFLAGGTLKDRLRHGPLPAPQAVAAAALLSDALAALHDAGYLHGDVKPSNVGFTSGGSPKLLDFGLARAANDAATMGGTLAYQSPEVLSGRAADEADDLWSLCVMLHEMVSGEHPFAGGDIEEVAGRIRRRHLAPGAGFAAGSDSSSRVLAFTASMLASPRSARAATAHAFGRALAEILN
ncbi:MAG: serine/threonine protein kinase [Acidobacteria bacterium]|nr:serine/threonine protein kinase [Acidobacteriota bacterium]